MIRQAMISVILIWLFYQTARQPLSGLTTGNIHRMMALLYILLKRMAIPVFKMNASLQNHAARVAAQICLWTKQKISILFTAQLYKTVFVIWNILYLQMTEKHFPIQKESAMIIG